MSKDGRQGSLVCTDMTRSQQAIAIEIDETKILHEGTYWLVIRNDEQS